MKSVIINMKKKIMAVLCSLAVLTTSGCSDLLYEYDEDAAIAWNDSAAEDSVSIQSDKSPFGISISLAEDGELSITRRSPQSVPMGEEGTWTVFVYLCGTDLESGNGLASMDIEEMLDASTGKNVKFVIQTGGTSYWENSKINSDEIQRFEICNGKMKEVDSKSLKSMGSPDTLSDFISWGVTNYPAAKMGLIFWNHGGGSISGVCFDEMNDSNSLLLSEMNSALASSAASMTDKFEFVGFDACLMGTIEAANILATYSRYMIGSQETEPGYGWDYKTIGDYLGKNPEADGGELGKVICDSFYDCCADIGAESGATLSVIDLSKIDDVTVSLNSYSKKLYEASEDTAVLSEIIRGIKEADNFGGNNKSEGYTNMVDLEGIINAGSAYADGADEVLNAIDNAVVYMKNGSDHTSACGLATYYPLRLQGSSELKIFGDVAVSPYYLSFVDRTVYSGVNETDTEEYDYGDLIGIWCDIFCDDSYSYDNCEANDEYWSYCDNYSVTGESPYIQFCDPPAFYDDVYGFSLTDESLEHTASVQASVYMISEDMVDVIELGLSVDIIPDWENGVFTDNFDGYWFSLPDGQTLSVYMVDECDGYDIYTSPVMVNGEETNLRITHDYANDTVTIDGVWGGIDECGMADRNIYELQSGDVIIPLYYAYAIDSDDEYYYYGAEYVFDGSIEIYFDLLPDGEYLYGFNIDDIYGDYYITDYVNFSIDGDEIWYDDLT